MFLMQLKRVLTIAALAAVAGVAQAGPPKVTICHKPPGNPANAHTIQVNIHAWPAHQAHEDTLGECDESNPPGGGGIDTGAGDDSDGSGGGDDDDGDNNTGSFEVLLCDERAGDHGRVIRVSETGRFTVQQAECE